MADDRSQNENIEDPISNDQEVINQEDEDFEDTDDLDDDQGMETE
jgi:hypothetical protein